ncbi:MAG: hypothetical protein Q9227_006061 [Pyrenula ochraceoflavens]
MPHNDQDSAPNPEFLPLHNICEFLTAVHIYTEEARQGKTRSVPATHYCSHVSKDLRQCLIYDSAKKDARLIGVEYMVPRHVYETFDPEEQKLWHSHEYEVSSGMLICPKPSSFEPDEWEKAELEAMKEIMGLYGKTWHFWQVDRGDKYPFGMPTLMGSMTEPHQGSLDELMAERNAEYGVHHSDKAKRREGIEKPGIHVNGDSWWKEAGKM